MPRQGRRPGALLKRVRAFIRRLGHPEPTGSAPAPEEPESAARWPHLVRGWLDPSMALGGWRTTVELSDVEDVLRAVALASDGRVGDAEVAEVVDVLVRTEVGHPRAFLFGRPRGFTQLWIGVVLGPPGAAKVFVLGDHAFIETMQKALSVGQFASAEKRAEYELLHRFFVAAWEWQWTAAPGAGELRSGTRGDFDPAAATRALERILSDPRAPFLEVLRGLRRRARDLLDETRELDRASVEAADAYLGRRGAPSLTEMRDRYWKGT